MSVPTVVDGIAQAADELMKRFGLERAITLAEAWAQQDPRWELVAENLKGRSPACQTPRSA